MTIDSDQSLTFELGLQKLMDCVEGSRFERGQAMLCAAERARIINLASRYVSDVLSGGVFVGWESNISASYRQDGADAYEDVVDAMERMLDMHGVELWRVDEAYEALIQLLEERLLWFGVSEELTHVKRDRIRGLLKPLLERMKGNMEQGWEVYVLAAAELACDGSGLVEEVISVLMFSEHHPSVAGGLMSRLMDSYVVAPEPVSPALVLMRIAKDFAGRREGLRTVVLPDMTYGEWLVELRSSLPESLEGEEWREALGSGEGGYDRDLLSLAVGCLSEEEPLAVFIWEKAKRELLSGPGWSVFEVEAMSGVWASVIDEQKERMWIVVPAIFASFWNDAEFLRRMSAGVEGVCGRRVELILNVV